jgi:hypothetical protein
MAGTAGQRPPVGSAQPYLADETPAHEYSSGDRLESLGHRQINP